MVVMRHRPQASEEEPRPCLRKGSTTAGGRRSLCASTQSDWLASLALSLRRPRKKNRGKHADEEGSLCSMHFLAQPLGWMQVGGVRPRLM